MMAEWERGELNGEWHIMTGWALSDGHDHGRTPGQVNVLCRKKKTSVNDRLPSCLLAYAWFAVS